MNERQLRHVIGYYRELFLFEKDNSAGVDKIRQTTETSKYKLFSELTITFEVMKKNSLKVETGAEISSIGNLILISFKANIAYGNTLFGDIVRKKLFNKLDQF